MKLQKNNEIRIKETNNGAIIQHFEEVYDDETSEPYLKEHLTIIEGNTSSYDDRKENIKYLTNLLYKIIDLLNYNRNKHSEDNLIIINEADIKEKGE